MTATTPAEVRWLTAAEAAEYARCHPDTLRAAAQSRALSGVKSGTSRQARWRFTTTDIDNWLEARPHHARSRPQPEGLTRVAGHSGALVTAEDLAETATASDPWVWWQSLSDDEKQEHYDRWTADPAERLIPGFLMRMSSDERMAWLAELPENVLRDIASAGISMRNRVMKRELQRRGEPAQ